VKSYIETPQQLPADQLGDYTSNRVENERKELELYLRIGRVSPDKFPKVIDIASGNGGVALVLTELGWRAENIVCLDKFVSPDTVVKTTQWVYADIDLLVEEIAEGRVDTRLEQYRQAFDLLTANYAFLNPREVSYLAKFLLKPEGKLLLEGVVRDPQDFANFSA